MINLFKPKELFKQAATVFGGPIGGAVADMIGGRGGSGNTSVASAGAGRDNTGLDTQLAANQTDTLNRSEAQNAFLNFNNQLQIENLQKQGNRDEQLSSANQNITAQKTIFAKAEAALNAELQKAQRG